MLGNFANGIFVGIDRWFVKILMTSTAFATYSFAVTMENMLNVFVAPISITMYNNFSTNNAVAHIKAVKQSVLLWGGVIIAVAFPCKWLLECFLTKYLAATGIIFLLFATQMFYVVIKGIYVNYYKVVGMQKRYLIQVLFMTLFSVVSNIILYSVFKSSIAIATATLFTAIAWFIVCEFEETELRYGLNEYISSMILIATYIFCGFKLSPVAGFVAYFSVYALLLVTLLRANIQIMIKFVGRK